MAARKTWQQKLADTKDLPKVMKMPDKLVGRYGKGTMVIPAPLEVDALMRRVPKGKLVTVKELHTAVVGQFEKR